MLRRTALNHVPGLDGLRGLAVAGVLLFHSGGLLRGGYLGVDLFFVLSGFLITSLLLSEERATGRIDLRAFWIRRARRLLPALLSLMPAIALYAKLLAQPAELRMLRADALATLAYVANWRSIFAHRSYWEMFVAPSPLEHTWSLAIEEQFYVVWPLAVLGVVAVARKQKERAVLVVSLVLAGASMVAMALLAANPTRAYLGTDTRGAAILLGAALAASGLARPSRVGARPVQAVGVLAAIVLAIAWMRLDGQSELLYRGGFWLTELAALVLVTCASRIPDGFIARGLSWAPFRRLGEISYGVYLWHWPIYVVLSEERTGLASWRLLSLRLALTLLFAILSYRFFERPIRQNGVGWGRPLLVVPSAIVLVVGVVLASTRTVVAANPVVFEPAPLPPPLPVAPDAAPPTNVLVVGDSVGIALGGRMGWDGKPENFLVEQRAVGDCSILEGIVPVHSMSGYPHGNPNCASSWKEDAAEKRPDIFLVVIGGAYFSVVEVGGKWRRACDTQYHDAYVKRLSALLGDVAPYAKRRVVLLAAYPVGKWQTPFRNSEVDCFNKILRDSAGAAGAEVLDINPWLCPDHQCTLKSKDLPVRPDGLHFDGRGRRRNVSLGHRSPARPAAMTMHVVVDGRIVRRVIKHQRGLSGLGLQVPHGHCCVVERGPLMRVVSESELGRRAKDLPEAFVLVARPEEPAPNDEWRRAFHGLVHHHLDGRVAAGTLTPSLVRQRISRNGQTEFDEIRAVLHSEDLLFSEKDDREAYIELRRSIWN